MGRSFLSVGLAAVFGLLVAAFVAIHEYTTPVAAEPMRIETAAVANADVVVLHVESDDGRCASVGGNVHAPRTTTIVVKGRT